MLQSIREIFVGYLQNKYTASGENVMILQQSQQQHKYVQILLQIYLH